ncbi:hypothetical protein DL767_001580 [Monosporascus sp. MG133]|nr:hypothetical protein DL767_001580 [Monosporascus sp. MG133]
MAAPEEAQERVESDLAPFDDNDSSYDAESVESTNSITSSLLEYRTIHGRTYQTSQTTEYWAPNDDQHLEAFDIAHQWLTMMLGDKLYAVPLGDNPKVRPSRPTSCVDASGLCSCTPFVTLSPSNNASDMADEFPSAEVIGTDISPTQPSWVPPNLSFQIDDAQLDWTFKPESFDFIHIRYMHAAIADWPRFYEQVYQFLKPGGWFQHIEPNIELRCDNPDVKFDDKHVFRQWAKLFYDAGDKIGRTFRFNEENMVKYARDAGFSEITHKKFTVPHGSWPKDKRLKEMGMYVGLYMSLSLDGFAVYPIGQILGWSLQEVQILVAKMRAAIKDPNNRTCSDMHMVYGRKPEYPTTAPTPAAEDAPSPVAAASSPAQAQAASSPARRS